MMDVPFEPRPVARFGIAGLGQRGRSMVPLLLAVPGAQITALYDVDPSAVAAAIASAELPDSAKCADFEQLCARDDVDFVYIATPWDSHAPLALTAMRAGKHVGVECPLATSIEDLWELVDTSERTKRHCLQLENCCYGRNELRVLRMVRAGLFGETLHASGGYLHDLRELLLSDTYYAGQWRRGWHTDGVGDSYPSHGLGPVAGYLGVHRGDRLARLTAMSTPAAGLADYRDRVLPAADPRRGERYRAGDVTMSLLQTELGKVVHLVHGVSNPHPYSRLNQLAGTRGAFEDFPPRIYLEPRQTDHAWGDFDQYAEYDHWLWTDIGPGPGGHGGMDFLMLYRLTQTLRLGLVPDIDVYDSAAWSAPFALSAESIARGGAAVDFPDFTRGRWKHPRTGLDSPKPRVDTSLR